MMKSSDKQTRDGKGETNKQRRNKKLIWRDFLLSLNPRYFADVEPFRNLILQAAAETFIEKLKSLKQVDPLLAPHSTALDNVHIHTHTKPVVAGVDTKAREKEVITLLQAVRRYAICAARGGRGHTRATHRTISTNPVLRDNPELRPRWLFLAADVKTFLDAIPERRMSQAAQRLQELAIAKEIRDMGLSQNEQYRLWYERTGRSGLVLEYRLIEVHENEFYGRPAGRAAQRRQELDIAKEIVKMPANRDQQLRLWFGRTGKGEYTFDSRVKELNKQKMRS
jgi:hypothetical protein